MFFGERDSRNGNGFSKSRLMRHHQIHLPLNDNTTPLFANRLFSLIIAKKNPRLVINLGLRRIDIFRFGGYRRTASVLENPTAESNNLAIGVSNRKHNAVPKAII